MTRCRPIVCSIGTGIVRPMHYHVIATRHVYTLFVSNVPDKGDC